MSDERAWDLWKFRIVAFWALELEGDTGSGAGIRRGAARVSVPGVLAGGGIGFGVVMAVFCSWHIVARGVH